MSFFAATAMCIQPIPAIVPGTCVKREDRHENGAGGFTQ
jgi:hypothetical protein